ncbi:hypothetical protein TELCIR_03094 [Teladorsagia circumcincta]|uniref:Uncharacterized protein n=1 Tax=Teladorsagia circumcincta TaxID=45464 RepID=A0A2G9UXC1_TELCI|nr:hypothetical protein TELCIR_03094 [Teladorsagia circumcincta]
MMLQKISFPLVNLIQKSIKKENGKQQEKSHTLILDYVKF